MTRIQYPSWFTDEAERPTDQDIAEGRDGERRLKQFYEERQKRMSDTSPHANEVETIHVGDTVPVMGMVNGEWTTIGVATAKAAHGDPMDALVAESQRLGLYTTISPKRLAVLEACEREVEESRRHRKAMLMYQMEGTDGSFVSYSNACDNLMAAVTATDKAREEAGR